MSGLKYAAATLVAGGAALSTGAASAATIVTQDLNLAAPTDGTSFSYDITLAGAAAPQFTFYGGTESVGTEDSPGLAVKHHLDSLGSARLGSGSYATNAMPSAGETYDQTGVVTYFKPTFSERGVTAFDVDPDNYYHLTFDANGSTYVGTADIGGDHSLKSISYIAAGAVPEPESWALLVLGAGATGAMMRRRRQLQAA